MSERVKVLVVDDSAFARKVMRDVVSAAPGFEVVGVARDGLEALEKVSSLAPDVLTLDLAMPHLDGLGVLAALSKNPRAPKVVVASHAPEDSAAALAALDAGAVTLVHKPTALPTDQLYEVAKPLLKGLREAAAARAPRPQPKLAPAWVAQGTPRLKLLAIGASTGGPQALTALLTALPGDFPVPVLVALHIPAGYSGPFAERVNAGARLSVVEATEGLLVRPGMAVIARAGLHLTVRRSPDGFRAHLDLLPADRPHHPSVDVLFESAAQAAGADVLGVVLTGMGDDGLRGARAIHAVGGGLLTEAASSCVVYGMPRATYEANLGAEQVPLEQMPHALVQRVGPPG